MLYLSKSKYCNLWQCPKLLWLNKFKPEEKTEDPALQARFDEGNVVGDLAMGLFGDYVEVTVRRSDGGLDLTKMIERTKDEMDADYTPPEQRPTTEQRVDALETTTDDIILMMAEIIGG